MIFDSLDNLHLYTGVHPGFAAVQAFLARTDLAALAAGRHPVDDRGAYASVNEYQTKPLADCFIECHRQFIDIQLIAWGEEKVGVAHKKHCIEQPYDVGNDLQKLSGAVDFITLRPGLFAVFFPHDAHEPCVSSDAGSVAVKKIVFKVPV